MFFVCEALSEGVFSKACRRRQSQPLMSKLPIFPWETRFDADTRKGFFRFDA